MAQAAGLELLKKLHGMVTDSFIQRLEADAKDEIPTDAATLGAITKFLKDNNVTADPATSEDLNSLRDKLADASKQRRSKLTNVLAMAKQDALGTGTNG